MQLQGFLIELAIVQASWTMPFRGLWETPLEAVYLDHSAAPRGLNKQPLVVFPINHSRP